MTLAMAQGTEGAPARCVQVSRIDRTEVIDDRTIVFYMRGRTIYVNRLDRACPGLDRGNPFSYRTSTSRICSADSITVLENTAFGLSRGFTCGLGEFEPSNEEAIALLKGDEEEADITVVPVEIDAIEVDPIDFDPIEADPIEVDPAQVDE
ncbi:MAG: DUF6491 family protein [Gammaproteobacteria bacterium]|jgi:hypothetical protein